ncbi:MAG TPA: hypothetical protein VFS90_16780 [Pyrinomonadaceae bacterium]|nr:hypothetical protein [Pyrinomonadaceae bacterium]
MSKACPRRNYCVCLVLISSVFLTGLLPLTGFANDRKRKPVVVSFGQPNIWSLEQAHYLLARMHMTNIELQAKTLTANDLDANATHGTRIQLLRQLLGIDAQFDQGIGFQNQRLVDNARFNDSRRRDLLTRRDKLQEDSLSLTREINSLTIERERMNSDTSATAEQKTLKDKEIQAKKDEQAVVKEQITQQNDELKTLMAEPSGTPTSPSASASPAQLPTSVLEKLIEKNADKLLEAAKDPKLNATTMLDNTIQLQYEIIAKQLTLLRDEVGPGERLVFLELPQSIYTTPGSGDEKMAQAWWHVNGYTRTDPLLRLLLEFYDLEQRWHDIQRVPGFKDFVKDFQACPTDSTQQTPNINTTYLDLKELYDALRAEHEIARRRIIEQIFREANVNFERVEQNGARDTSETIEAVRKRFALDQHGLLTLKPTQPRTIEVSEHERVQNIKWELLNILSQKQPNVCERQRFSLDQGLELMRLDDQQIQAQGLTDLQRRTVRTVDIIPRQSSLNVNDIQDTVKATGILAGFKFLFGFAGQVNFQRQREQFEQFLHQELYASGFGKGNRDFGWTFGALPGTKRVAPGVRTTYAALVVPDDAESLVMSARGCYFPRKNYQPLDFNDTGNSDWSNPDRFNKSNCGDNETYILTIPGGGNTSDFWVTNIDYQEGQNNGDFQTVSVRGNNFSSQMGVLINGVPLLPTVGLAHPQLMPRSTTNSAAPAVVSDCTNVQGICGRYERIDPQQIVFSFRMHDAFKGIPTITLVAPGKSVDLNTIPNVRINRKSNSMLRDDGPFMFGKRPPRLSISDVQLLNVDSNSGTMEALVEGRGFDVLSDRVYVNDVEVRGLRKDLKSPGLYKLSFPKDSSDTLEFKIVQANEVATKFVPNPGSLEIISATVVSYDPPVAKKSPGVMTVKLQVSIPSRRLSIDTIQGASTATATPGATSVEAIVRLINPEATVVISLRDNVTSGVASVVVQRPKEPPKPAEQPTPKPKEEPKPKPCLVPLCTAN